MTDSTSSSHCTEADGSQTDTEAQADSVLVEQEYETQYFGFTPKSFCDGVYNAIIEYIHDGLDLVHKYITQQDIMTEDMLHQASESMLLMFIRSFDKAFDKLEVYLMSNILHIPNNVVLPEDVIHTEVCFTEDDEENIDEEIVELRRKITYTKYWNNCLKHELLETEKVHAEYENVLKQLYRLEALVCESGVSTLKESVMFTVSKANKLRETIHCLPDIVVQQKKRSIEDAIDMSAKLVKPS